MPAGPLHDALAIAWRGLVHRNAASRQPRLDRESRMRMSTARRIAAQV